MTARASLTCFLVCFLSGRAKDLSAPGIYMKHPRWYNNRNIYIYIYIYISKFKVTQNTHFLNYLLLGNQFLSTI